jgi:segregation and condensation protein A
MGIVVTFLAMLELAKEMLVEIIQEAPRAPIYLRAKTGHSDEPADTNRRDAPEVEPSPLAGATTP